MTLQDTFSGCARALAVMAALAVAGCATSEQHTAPTAVKPEAAVTPYAKGALEGIALAKQYLAADAAEQRRMEADMKKRFVDDSTPDKAEYTNGYVAGFRCMITEVKKARATAQTAEAQCQKAARAGTFGVK